MAVPFYARLVQPLVGIGMATLFGASMLPDTLLLSSYQKAVASYDGDAVEKPLPQTIVYLQEKILERVNLAAQDEANLALFTCFGSDTLHKGSLTLRTGAIVGIPENYGYDTVDDVDESRLSFGDRSIDWEGDAGRGLKQSLVLSRAAKAFGISREIMYANTYNLWIDGSLRAFFLYSAYASGRALRVSLGLDHRLKKWARCTVYALVGVVFACGYVVCSDTYACWRDGRADSRAAALHPTIAGGGVLFYDAALQRNIALRQLVADGPSHFTACGNVVTNWRRPHMELSARRNRLEKLAAQSDLKAADHQDK